MTNIVDRLIELLARLPTTNARIAVSLLLTMATGVRVLITWTAPPWEWLVFLAAALGLDVAQFGWKRATWKGNGETPSDA